MPASTFNAVRLQSQIAQEASDLIGLEINGTRLEDIELIIFDKDGTLFELYPFFSRVAMVRGLNICSGLGADESLAQWIALKMGVDIRLKRVNGPIGIYSREYIQDLLCSELKDIGYSAEKEIIISAFRKTDEYFNDESVLKSSLVPVKGLFDFLKCMEGRCKGAVFSYDLTDRLELISRAFGMSKNLDMFLGGDRILRPKPDPWGALKIMSDLHISPENTALIGDSVFDMECARRAKCRYVITMLSDISGPGLLRGDSGISAPVPDAAVRDFTEINVD